jgi:transcriptional regulator with XRE-family HTH domain
MKKKTNIEGYEKIKVGANIRKWRNIKEVKQKDLASSLRLSEAAISNIENDLTDITLSQLENIALSLEIEIEQLFTDPQEIIESQKYINTNRELSNDHVMEKELMYALIGQIQKKDEQLKEVLNNVMFTFDNFNKSYQSIKTGT